MPSNSGIQGLPRSFRHSSKASRLLKNSATGRISPCAAEVPGQQTLVLLGSVEERIPRKHPLREMKRVTDIVLARMGNTFDSMYSSVGRPSIPPERLLKAQLLIALYSIRSDRQFCEQLEYNLMYRWFLDMNLDEPVFDPSTFSTIARG